MGFYKDRQLALVESGMSFERANRALESKEARVHRIRSVFESAADPLCRGPHVRFTVNGRSQRRQVIEVYDHAGEAWVETASRTIRLDLVTEARLD